MAEYYRQEGTAGRRQGIRGRQRQVREVFFAESRNWRLVTGRFRALDLDGLNLFGLVRRFCDAIRL